MDIEDHETGLARVASAMAEPARSRMLCCLMDGCARTSTELAVVAGVGAPTASAHLQRMKRLGLVEVWVQGRHRYYRLANHDVAQALEALMVVANPATPRFVPSTPAPLRMARTCYDHLAGTLGVAWHDRLLAMAWIAPGADAIDYVLTDLGVRKVAELGMDSELSPRRRFAYPCMDWSMRRPHVGGALGAALLELGIRRGWLQRQLDSRALTVTNKGLRELESIFGITQLAVMPA
ncbi:metalloregulator ArsR/SmtB family transcription factor [Dyella sp. GSA-30]|uniref:ArsR/SmtB family transcription factor n=1 Tax=Dyella sp. GSA-30 TaxID=2994496 RepID=UPI0024923563|nr:metalloregulator ArsR/SmtB family transcription factor [Dyella sp. GSA-30]BDU21077.1 transcriptional regulator [Dyella sp. GSA-30]